MFYLIEVKNRVVYYKPELNSGGSTPLAFKQSYMVLSDDEFKSFSGVYKIIDRSNNKNKLLLRHHHQTLIEFKENGFAYFLPSKYKQFLDEFNKLQEEFPEYVF